MNNFPSNNEPGENPHRNYQEPKWLKYAVWPFIILFFPALLFLIFSYERFVLPFLVRYGWWITGAWIVIAFIWYLKDRDR